LNGEVPMNFWNQIVKWLTKKFWPWFVKYVWPFIKKRMIDIITIILDHLQDETKDFMSSKFKDREENAKQKAREAEQKASVAKNAADSEKYRTSAKIWRKVAETYKKDNEELKQKIEILLNKTKKEVKSEIGALDIDANFSGEDTHLTIGNTSYMLPLPERMEPED